MEGAQRRDTCMNMETDQGQWSCATSSLIFRLSPPQSWLAPLLADSLSWSPRSSVCFWRCYTALIRLLCSILAAWRPLKADTPTSVATRVYVAQRWCGPILRSAGDQELWDIVTLSINLVNQTHPHHQSISTRRSTLRAKRKRYLILHTTHDQYTTTTTQLGVQSTARQLQDQAPSASDYTLDSSLRLDTGCRPYISEAHQYLNVGDTYYVFRLIDTRVI